MDRHLFTCKRNTLSVVISFQMPCMVQVVRGTNNTLHITYLNDSSRYRVLQFHQCALHAGGYHLDKPTGAVVMELTGVTASDLNQNILPCFRTKYLQCSEYVCGKCCHVLLCDYCPHLLRQVLMNSPALTTSGQLFRQSHFVSELRPRTLLHQPSCAFMSMPKLHVADLLLAFTKQPVEHRHNGCSASESTAVSPMRSGFSNC